MRLSEFYSGDLNASTYDLGVGRGGPSGVDDVGFYRDLAGPPGSEVLELGCGTGRVLIPLAEAGLRVTGLDRSPGMLAQAAAKIDRLPATVRAAIHIVRGDLADFAFDMRFDAVLIPARAFAFLLTAEAQLSCLTLVLDHLRPGGVLAVDLFDPLLDRLVPGRTEARADSRIDPESGHIIRVDVLSRENDTVAQILREVWRFTESTADGVVLRSEDEELALRWTYRYEMRHLLALAGFRSAIEYSDFVGSPPAYGGEQVWVAHREP
jgi:SAM-dependent methyltransferase